MISQQNGNIFTVLLAAVALVAGLSYYAYNTVSGPLRTEANLQNLEETRTRTKIALKAVTLEIPNQLDDCDDDGFKEARKWEPSGAGGPSGGGLLPTDIGVRTTDAFGTPLGYCVWDTGSAIGDLACGGSGGRLAGSDTPLTEQSDSGIFLAVISAGADKAFTTTCSGYSDSATPVMTATGDDIVSKYTYAQASAFWDTTDTAPEPEPPSAAGKTVFVTNASVLGNFGGLSTADALCQQEADAAGLTGTYKAWLSSSTQSPTSRMTKSLDGYVLPDGTLIANDWGDLTDGTIQNPINRFADGTLYGADSVWTGTQADGSNIGNDPLWYCEDWTNQYADDSTGFGATNYTNAYWTEESAMYCDITARFYCFEQ